MWNNLNYLIGSWQGTGSGQPGKDFEVYTRNHFYRVTTI